MMNTNEMVKISFKTLDDRQKRAFKNIKWAACNLLGQLENTLSDYCETDEEYIDAKNLIENHEDLANEIYDMAISGIYGEGFEGFGKQYQRQINDIKFCGKDWLMACVEDRLAREGY